MIYLDNAATTKPKDIFLDAYDYASKNLFFNSSAIYREGVYSQEMIDEVKQIILKKLGLISSENFIFTNSATIANNLAIQGSYRKSWKEVIISSGEHPSVFNTVEWLQARGVVVHFVPLQKNGQIRYDKLEELCNSNTSFISIMTVNNETGSINDLTKICQIKQRCCPKALLHTDAVQAFCKLDINLSNLTEIDFLTISSHKIGGSKGLGGLYYSKLSNLKPIIFGGGQEKGLNSGTQDIAAIYGLGQLVKSIDISKNLEHVLMLKKSFLELIQKCSYIKCNSDESCSPYILSLTFPFINGETLIHALEEKHILVSTGSACSSKKKGNRILSALGVNDKDIISSIRVSFCADNTLKEVSMAAEEIINTYNNLKQRMNIDE